jgi:hypothetical protein
MLWIKLFALRRSELVESALILDLTIVVVPEYPDFATTSNVGPIALVAHGELGVALSFGKLGWSFIIVLHLLFFIACFCDTVT